MSIQFSLRYCLGPAHQTGHLWTALALMPFGMLFDFFDGMVARWRGKSSLMGAELDSLADLVSKIGQDIQLSLEFAELTHCTRFRLALLLPFAHSLQACAPASISCSSPASSSLVSLVWLASTSPPATCPRTPMARPSTSKDYRSPQVCQSWDCWHSGCQRAGFRETYHMAPS
jgi:hypothetical protein